MAVRLAVLAALLAVLVPLVATSTASAQANPIRINEFVAQNETGLADATGATPDWIELHNSSGTLRNLAGWVLADGSDTFEFGSVSIAAGGYLVVFASGDTTLTTPSEIHLPFKLSSGGESLTLTSPAGVLANPAWPAGSPYPPQVPDTSFGVGAGGALFYFTNPTPGAANASGGLGGLVEPVAFSVPHGFYSAAQTVTLSTATPSTTIRYTIDGSTPSSSNGTALVSGQSVSIATTTTLRAVGVRNGWIDSQVETRSYFFANDIIDQSAAAPPGWPADLAVNAQVFDYGMDPNVVGGNRATIRNALQAIPTISVVTDLDNLFDPTSGIYVNALRRGSAWERPASIELIDPSGAEPGFDINGGIRMRGGFSRIAQNPKHSLRLFFRNDYETVLDYELFGAEGTDEFEKLDLRTAQNYGWSWRHDDESTFVEELWNRDTQAAMDRPYTRSRPYHVYLNGRYWGLYMSQERVSGEYAASYFGGDPDDYDIVKRGAPAKTVEATNGTLDAFQSLWPLISDGTVTPSEFTQIESQVDLANLADYYVLHFFSGDFDGSPSFYMRNPSGQRWAQSNNWYAVRNRAGTGPAGKWTFFDHDSEHSLCANGGPMLGANIDNTTPWPLMAGAENMSPGWLHQSLISNPTYRQIFTDSVNRHLIDPAGVLNIAPATARLELRVSEVSGAIDAESARWGDGPDSTQAVYGRPEWNTAVQRLRDCIVERQAIVKAQLTADGLWPNATPPVISPSSGAIAWGSPITIATNGQQGTIRYTTDGTDPRAVDGSPSPTSQVYTGPIEMNESDLVVNARIIINGSWSPMVDETYTLSAPVGPVRLLLNEFNAVSSSNYLGGGGSAEVANGSDPTLGRIAGNGGDWIEFVVVEDNLDIRGWTIEVFSDVNGERQQSAALTFGDDAVLSDLWAGSIVTISESIADDVSYNPVIGDWHLNLQSDDNQAGAYITSNSQSDFIIDHRNTQIAVFDELGQPEALRTGEGTVDGAGVGSNEVFKLEGVPSSAITANDGLYNDGTNSSWGLPNVWSNGATQQDVSNLRAMFGDVNCDGFTDVIDALFISQYDASVRLDGGGCPLQTPTQQLNAAVGDVNTDGFTDVIDALFIAQCDASVPNPFCPAG